LGEGSAFFLAGFVVAVRGGEAKSGLPLRFFLNTKSTFSIAQVNRIVEAAEFFAVDERTADEEGLFDHDGERLRLILEAEIQKIKGAVPDPLNRNIPSAANP
jgi:hypothetical protein